MKDKYTTVEINIIEFESGDIITTSNTIPVDPDPSGQ